MLVNDIHLTQLNAPIQRIKARVELYLGSTLTSICHCGETLRDFTVERTGENKFFGFGICQKINGTLIDLHKEIDISKEHTVEAAFGVDADFIYPFPKFYIQDFNRDEVSGTVTFTGFDILYKAENYTYADMPVGENYTIRTLTSACGTMLQVPIKFINIDEATLETVCGTEGAAFNFTGRESVRRVLDVIAEFTQSIYYMNNEWELVFRRLNPAEEAALTIDGGQYISFEDCGGRRLKNLMSVTAGEDNVHTEGEGEGVTQFIRDNPLLDLRNDLGSLLEQAQENVGGMTIAQFDMTWSGNYLLEIGDKIDIEAEDSTITSYLLDDAITFDGGLMQVSGWHFDENEGERASNPVTLGQALNETYIRIDKANKRIDMLVSENTTDKDAIAAITMNIDSISQSVTEVQKNVENQFENIEGELVTITNKVETLVTPEAFEIGINNVIDNGVKKVESRQGFVFDESGLTIEDSNSDIKTQISEDGMRVYRGHEEVLTADNQGVKAEDLHATTYLIIGTNSRFENYGSGRTACFWIGD